MSRRWCQWLDDAGPRSDGSLLATKWDGQWQLEVADGGFASADAGVDGPVLVFGVKPAKVLAFGKGEFSHTRYRPS
jgi:hypothetical protein